MSVESLAEIRLVIGVEFTGQMESDFVDKPRQMHPAAHGFARAAWIDNFAHHRES